MKRTDRNVSKALRDVWAWKEAIYSDVKDLPVEKALTTILDLAQQSSAGAKPGRQFRQARKKPVA
jgi:hypothetical protein